MGEIPGRKRGHDPQGRPRLLVALDTSQSMDDATIQMLAQEIALLAALANITVVECDESIRRVYDYNGDIRSVCGRGGTDFRPVFVPEFLQKHRPDGVVYLTDGDGKWPLQDPRIKTLWVLTGDAERFGCPWGRRVSLIEHTSAAVDGRG